MENCVPLKYSATVGSDVAEGGGEGVSQINLVTTISHLTG